MVVKRLPISTAVIAALYVIVATLLDLLFAGYLKAGQIIGTTSGVFLAFYLHRYWHQVEKKSE